MIVNDDINHIYFHIIILTVVLQMKECVLCATESAPTPGDPVNE